jgi:hypothetical protein
VICLKDDFSLNEDNGLEAESCRRLIQEALARVPDTGTGGMHSCNTSDRQQS